MMTSTQAKVSLFDLQTFLFYHSSFLATEVGIPSRQPGHGHTKTVRPPRHLMPAFPPQSPARCAGQDNSYSEDLPKRRTELGRIRDRVVRKRNLKNVYQPRAPCASSTFPKFNSHGIITTPHEHTGAWGRRGISAWGRRPGEKRYEAKGREK